MTAAPRCEPSAAATPSTFSKVALSARLVCAPTDARLAVSCLRRRRQQLGPQPAPYRLARSRRPIPRRLRRPALSNRRRRPSPLDRTAQKRVPPQKRSSRHAQPTPGSCTAPRGRRSSRRATSTPRCRKPPFVRQALSPVALLPTPEQLTLSSPSQDCWPAVAG